KPLITRSDVDERGKERICRRASSSWIHRDKWAVGVGRANVNQCSIDVRIPNGAVVSSRHSERGSVDCVDKYSLANVRPACTILNVENGAASYDSSCRSNLDRGCAGAGYSGRQRSGSD